MTERTNTPTNTLSAGTDQHSTAGESRKGRTEHESGTNNRWSTPQHPLIGLHQQHIPPLGGVVGPVDWQPFAHSPKYPIVVCSGCGDRLVNESNVLHRLGWTESTTTPRRFRCGWCSEPEAAA